MAVLDNTFQGERLQGLHRQNATTGNARQLRVLLIITGLAAGGATNVVLDIARHLKDRPGFDLHLLTGPPPPGRTDVTGVAYELGIKTRVIPTLINHLDPLTNMRAVATIRRIIVEGRYDVVHTHSSVAGVVGRFAALAAGTPTILHHVHGWPPYQQMPAALAALYLHLERLCARFTSRIITVSRLDIQKGLEYRICDEAKFTLIYNGIDLEKFQQETGYSPVREQLRLAPHSKLVGMVGRLDRQKNPLDFIRAAALVAREDADVHFLLLGDGALRYECEVMIRELALTKRVHLLGYRSDVDKILPLLSVVAMSSLWEGLPIAFLEAMAAGKPIVANNVDGVSEIVVEGETGFLVPPQQPEQMAAAILTLLRNQALRDEMGRLAQQRSQDFSVARMVGQLESLYQELSSTVQHRALV